MHGIGTIDYAVIGIYLVFMLAIGPVYSRFSSTASDFFRGGGGMLWWMVGASAWVMGFTAWTFTGGAGEVYSTGVFFLLLISGNLVGTLFTYAIGPWFRQMRVITGIEAVFHRFGRSNEQFFTWIPVPFGILFGGIGLYAIAIFMAIVFKVQVHTVIIALGAVVTLMSVFGGSWAVVASDFVQMLTIMVITIVVSYLALATPAVGGVSGMIDQLPAAHFDWTEFDRPSILWIFAITLIINQVVQTNSILSGSSRFVFCKTGHDVRRALWITILGTILFTPLFILPAMTATILHPELGVMRDLKPLIAQVEQAQGAPVENLSQLATAAEASGDTAFTATVARAQDLDIALDDPLLQMNNPTEAAYVKTAMSVLPAGMLGLLVCGIFAATMSSMDSGLNRAAGILVRNFYIVYIEKHASETRQIVIGKLMTAVLGVAQIIVGLILVQYQELSLFNLILLLAAIVGMPMAVPLLFGMFIKRTPPWSAWSTTMAGFVTAMVLHPQIVGLLTEDNLQRWFGATEPLNATELGHLNIAITTGAIFLVCLLWFLGTIPFYGRSSERYKQRVESFFTQMHTPIDPVAEGVPGWEEDRRHYHVMGILCLLYGGFILLMALLPNPLWGRLCFVFCGGLIGGLGLMLYLIGRRRVPLESDVPEEVYDPEAHRPTRPGIREIDGQPPRILPPGTTSYDSDAQTSS